MAELNTKWDNIMDNMNYGLQSRRNSGQKNVAQSRLPEVEEGLIAMFYSYATPEQIEIFKANLVTNPNVMDNPEQYQGLSRVGRLANDLLMSNVVQTPTIINNVRSR